jgi:hypothetical protein
MQVTGHEDNPNSIPGLDNLLESKCVFSFLDENSAYHLKPGELEKAKEQIKCSIMVNPYLYGQLQAGCGSNLNSIEPKALLDYLFRKEPFKKDEISTLVGFLWATAK